MPDSIRKNPPTAGVNSMTRRLTGLDAAFLALETPTSTGHVGGLSILDPRRRPSPSRSSDDGDPRLASRCCRCSGNGCSQCRWGSTSPCGSTTATSTSATTSANSVCRAPGSDEQLAEQVSRIHARPGSGAPALGDLPAQWAGRWPDGGLHQGAPRRDRRREWRRMLTLLFDLSPEAPTPGPAPEFSAATRTRCRPARGAGDRAVGLATRRGGEAGRQRGPRHPGRRTRRGAARRQPARPRSRTVRRRGVIKSSTPLVAPPTLLNVAISPHRRFAFARSRPMR